MPNWAKDLHDTLKTAERIAAAGGAYGLADRLRKIAEPFAGVLKDEAVADLIAEVAGVERRPDDVCIVEIPPHWLDGLREKADIPRRG